MHAPAVHAGDLSAEARLSSQRQPLIFLGWRADEEGMTDINSAPRLVGTHTPAAHRNRVLGRHSWTVLRDMRRPGDINGRIDRLFVGPGGIVVVESARWVGDAAVERGGLRHNGEMRDDVVEHVGMTAAYVSAILPPELRTSVRAVLSLAYQDVAPTAVGPADVMGEVGLEQWLLALPARLDVGVADQAACLLLEMLAGRTPDVSTSSELDAPRRRRAQLTDVEDLHLQMTTIVPPVTGTTPVVPAFVTPAAPRSALVADAVPAPRSTAPRRSSGLWSVVWFGAAFMAFLHLDTIAGLLG